MLRKKQVVTMVSIATISFLIGTTISFAVASDGNPFDKIWQAIYDLQARVTALEQGTNTKTWHFVTSFTLSSEERVSSLFFVQGEKWRIKWEPQAIQTWLGFIVWDENGYAVYFGNTGGVLSEHHEAKGIYYVPQGEGYYQIESLPGPNINFTIESYH